MKRVLQALVLASIYGAAYGSAVDPVTSLIEQQTNLTSEAGQKGDQATVDRFTADEILFSAGDGTIQRDDKFDIKDSLAERLKSATREFHMQRPGSLQLVEKNAAFVDEAGTANPISDFSGVPKSLDDWVLHRRDDVAVASFTLDSPTGRYLAVEIWKKHPGRWLLAGGQTIALHSDPTIIALSSDALGAYAGVYSAGAGSSLLIQVADQGLTSTAPGAEPKPLKPEAEDVFFTPGLPSGYPRFPTTFMRDQTGAVAGFSKNGIDFRKTDEKSIFPGPAPVPGQLMLREFRVAHSGGLAIATFFHDRSTNYYGQTLHQTFRSMEAWIDDHGVWKMISSQGCQV